MEGGIKAMRAIEERGQIFWTRASYKFFQRSYLDIQFTFLQFLKVKIAACNTENV